MFHPLPPCARPAPLRGVACAFASLVAGSLPAASLPHDPGLSSLTVERAADATIVRVAFSNQDFAAASGLDRDRDGTMSADELRLADAAWQSWLAGRIELRGGHDLRACRTVAARIGEERDVELELRYEPQQHAVSVVVPFLGELSHGHRCYACLLDAEGGIAAEALLHAGARELALPAAGEPAAPRDTPALAWAFFVCGVEHILIGYDHLAFLLALLAVGLSLRRTLLTITAFSVAHSLTLTAAALDWLHLPGGMVEATIAGSIVVVAVANLVQRDDRKPQRWPWAFAFGLIHGFGFAGVLREFVVGGESMLVPLFSFNLGVEVGQVACAIVAVPVLACIAKRYPAASTTWLSVGAGLIGTYWLVERVL